MTHRRPPPALPRVRGIRRIAQLKLNSILRMQLSKSAGKLPGENLWS
jgi:hypothetical protein